MNKILCIGEALIDLICTDKGQSLSSGQHFLKKPGGAPANVAAAIAALGGHVELAAKVGIDPFGSYLKQVVTDFGVGTQWMLQDIQHFTTFAFVSLMENGERDFYFNRGADAQLTVEDIENIDISTFAIVHFGSATAFLPGPLQLAYISLLQKCLSNNVFVSFDPNYRHLLFQNHTATFVEQSWNFLRHCGFFKVSDEEALLLTGAVTLEEAITQLLEKTKAVFAITLGERGTLVGMDGETFVVPSISITPVDTTGAGDAFTGAVIYQLAEAGIDKVKDKEAWQQIVANANKAGARTCQYMGAMEAFKHLSSDIFV